MGSVKKRWWAMVGPGLLVAATGVGAGDLATGAFAGSRLGPAVLWAVVVGAGLKFVLNEGLARWQLATGSTLLEGAARHLGRASQWVFLGYLLVWSFFVGSALLSACGATAHAVLPWSDARTDKILYGVAHSAVAVALVQRGGYRLFERVMRVCIAVMFAVVLVTAVRVHPAWGDVARGLLWPRVPQLDGPGLEWTVALMGGVGGTVTVLCYGYWIREENRHGEEDLKICRVDLAVGYAMTALFGIAMVIIGNTVTVHGGGAGLLVDLAGQLERILGPPFKWAFLAGAWGAVFSSLLGVWQSVPYLFADCWQIIRSGASEARAPVDTRSRPYRFYLLALATLPAIGLWLSFERAQKWYAVFGAFFMPLLALTLIVLNGRSRWIGRRYRNAPLTTAVLSASLLFFLYLVWLKAVG